MKICLLEDEAPLYNFYYNNQKSGRRANNDRNPSVIWLGEFIHPSTGNNLWVGLNLNYMSPKQREELRLVLPLAMSETDSLYRRVHILLNQLVRQTSINPNNVFRYYDRNFVSGVDREVFQLPDIPIKDIEKAETPKQTRDRKSRIRDTRRLDRDAQDADDIEDLGASAIEEPDLEDEGTLDSIEDLDLEDVEDEEEEQGEQEFKEWLSSPQRRSNRLRID